MSRVAPVLAHDALVFETDEMFVDTLVPFLRDGLEAGAPVAVASTAAHLDLLRGALGPEAADVRFFVDDDWYVRPAMTVHGWHRELRRRPTGSGSVARFVGEVKFGDDPSGRRSWTRYESALNEAFATAPVWIVCPYDVRRLPRDVVEDASRTHPTVWEGGRAPSAGFEPPEEFLRSTEELPIAVAGSPALSMSVGTTPASCRAALREIVGASVSGARIDDLVLAVGELLTNTVVHGGATGTLDVWIRPGEVVAEVRDHGGGIIEPVAGYRPPNPGDLGGWGLWIVRQLADAVTIDSAPDAVTCVRIAVRS